jgi:hypothetical protein
MELPRRIHDLSLLVSAEYLEIPGLRLTTQQVERLWDIDPVTADALLGLLTEAKFLKKTSDNAYVRPRDGEAASQEARRATPPLVNTETVREWRSSGALRRAV